MSTQPPRPTPKAASKRRAATRRRNRELMRRLGALFFILIFVLGTVALAFSAQTATNTQIPATTVAGTTPAPGSTVIQVTAGIPSPTGGSAIEQIVAKADEAAAK